MKNNGCFSSDRAVEKEIHFKTQWDALVWMREELRKRKLVINPLSKDFNDKIWFRYFEER